MVAKLSYVACLRVDPTPHTPILTCYCPHTTTVTQEEEAFWEEFDDDPFYHEAFDDMHVEEGDEEEWDGGSSSESNIRNRINDLSRSTLECGRTDHDINFLSGPLRSDPDDSSMMRVHALAVSSPHCTASAEGHQQVVFSGDGEIMVYCLEPHQVGAC